MSRVPWSATSRIPYASWVANLPRPGAHGDVERLVGVASAVLAAGREERVFDVLELPAPDRFEARRDGPYEAWLARQLADHGRVPFFDFGWGAAATPDGQLRTPSTLAYPDAAGAVHESEVADAGALLRELGLWPEEYERWLAAHVPPLHVHGDTVERDAPRGTRLRITLPTSVWFPWVHDPYGDDPAWWPNPAGARNAPRLNAFLAATRAAVEGAGGTWAGADDEEVDIDYQPLAGEDGILLDAAP